MARLQQHLRYRRPAAVLHAVPLLLCLALLVMLASAGARPAPTENDLGSDSPVARQSDVEVTEQVPQGKPAGVKLGDTDEVKSEDSKPLPDSTCDTCWSELEHRILQGDYGSPVVDPTTHPAGPLP